MRVKAFKGFPTTFYFKIDELTTQYELVKDLVKDLQKVGEDSDYSAFTYKSFTGYTLIPKNTVLEGGFIVPDSFYGTVYDLCKIYDLYLTNYGFSKNVITTGSSSNGSLYDFYKPILIGDVYNNKVVTYLNYNYNNETRRGNGYVNNKS